MSKRASVMIPGNEPARRAINYLLSVGESFSVSVDVLPLRDDITIKAGYGPLIKAIEWAYPENEDMSRILINEAYQSVNQ